MLKEYEITVIKLLLEDIFSSEQIDEILQNPEFLEYDYTGAGYFLTIKHSILPIKRTVCDRPTLMGKTEDGIICGFVIFIENFELTIECHSWGEINIPENFREKVVQIEINNPLIHEN